MPPHSDRRRKLVEAGDLLALAVVEWPWEAVREGTRLLQAMGDSGAPRMVCRPPADPSTGAGRASSVRFDAFLLRLCVLGTCHDGVRLGKKKCGADLGLSAARLLR